MDEMEMNALAQEAAAIDADLSGAQFEAAPTVSLNENFKPVIVKFLNFAAGLGNQKIPFTSEHFSPQANEVIAESVCKVADVEGIDLGGAFGDPNSRLGAWGALLIAVGLPSFTFYMALKDYKPKTDAPAAEVPAGAV